VPVPLSVPPQAALVAPLSEKVIVFPDMVAVPLKLPVQPGVVTVIVYVAVLPLTDPETEPSPPVDDAKVPVSEAPVCMRLSVAVRVPKTVEL
jgi:hypothetical protein